jgi:hypothetical protein
VFCPILIKDKSDRIFAVIKKRQRKVKFQTDSVMNEEVPVNPELISDNSPMLASPLRTLAAIAKIMGRQEERIRNRKISIIYTHP